jgi:hypothetical protein
MQSKHLLGRPGPSALAAGIAVLVAALVAAAPALANVPLTEVSSDPYTNTTSFHATEVEPDTFSFAGTMVSVFQVGRFRDGGASNIGWATTSNSGASYTNGFLPGTTPFASPAGPYARLSDPSVAFDAKHGVWLIESLTLSASVGGAGVIVDRSVDGGITFGPPITVVTASGSANLDKPWLVCDDAAASPHYGNCYAEWDDAGGGSRLHMAFSSDGGLTWTASSVPSAGVIGGQPLVKRNGNVIMPIENAAGTSVESFVSTDGGLTYTGPFTISSLTSHTEAGNLRSPALPTAEINAAGKVYVVWADCRFRASCAANDLVFSTSTTGTTWTAVKRVPIDATSSGVDHFVPGLAVDRATSGTSTRLGLTYYFYPNTSCTTATCQLDVGFIGSTNSGKTWTAPTQLAGPTTLTQLPLTTQGYMAGDYLSTSFVPGSGGDVALPVFAVGMPVPGTTCTLGAVTSCDVPMEAPSTALTASAATRAATTGPILSRRSDHAPPVAPLTVR